MSVSKSIKTPVEYRAIPGFPAYRVGNDGTMWSRHTIGCKSVIGMDWRKMKPSLHHSGRYNVKLSRNGKVYHRQVSRLVLEAFVGPCPPGMECAHWDGNPLNNRLSNLRWATPKENQADRIRHGRTSRGEQCGKSKLTDEQVLEIRRLRKQGLKCRVIGERFGTTKVNVSLICNRKRWKHI